MSGTNLGGGTPEPATSGHWVEQPGRGHVAASVIEIALLGSVAATMVAIFTGSPAATVAVVIAAMGLIVLVQAIAAADVTTTDLRGSLLTIEYAGEVRTVDLAGSVQTHGHAGHPDWGLSATSTDGDAVELGPRHVDARTVEAAVRHYRAVAGTRRTA